MSPSFGFLDGDLIESFLHLSFDRMEELLESPKSVGKSVEEIVHVIEELSRLH